MRRPLLDQSLEDELLVHPTQVEHIINLPNQMIGRHHLVEILSPSWTAPANHFQFHGITVRLSIPDGVGDGISVTSTCPPSAGHGQMSLLERIAEALELPEDPPEGQKNKYTLVTYDVANIEKLAEEP